MKRLAPIALVLLTALLAGCLGPPAGYGNISVVSEPQGARIFLDDRDTGRTTPAVLESVRTGTHEVRVELEGYEPQAQTVRVTRGQTVTVSFSWLEPEPPDEEPPPDPTYARVSGYVSENLAGRRLPGAMVTAYEAGTKKAVASAETDEAGAYVLYVPAGTYDVIAEKPGHAQAKRQSLTVGVAERATANFISKKLRDPSQGAVAPTLHVYLEEEVDGEIVRVPFEPGTVIAQGIPAVGVVVIDAEYDIVQTHIRIGNRGYARDFEGGLFQEQVEFFLWDLYDAPGETELVITTYDFQDNWTELSIPFAYEVGEPTYFVPPVDAVFATAVTYGHDLGLYRARQRALYDVLGLPGDPDVLELSGGVRVDTTRLDKDVTMLVQLNWSPVEGAAGYEIERAYSRNGPWESLGKIGWWMIDPDTGLVIFQDVSPDLAPGKTVYYRVRALGPNDEKGAWSPLVWVVPLDRFVVYLEEPADHAVNVPLTPTFRWTYQDVGADEYVYDIFVAGVTGVPGGESGYYAWYYEGLVNETEAEYNFDGTGVDLVPGKTYSWNIVGARAYAFYGTNSLAVSYAWEGLDSGRYSGAANGEFVFTTALDE